MAREIEADRRGDQLPPNMPWRANPGKSRLRPTLCRKVLAEVLYENRSKGELACILELMPGAKLPIYVHPNAQIVFVLRGSIYDSRGVCQAGECLWRTPGSCYDYRSDEGALLFAFSRTRELPGHIGPVASALYEKGFSEGADQDG